jgi:hypothetical protein
MENAIPMVDSKQNRVSEVDLKRGFVWEHEGYETRNQGMRASRTFIPPFAIE